MNNCWSRYTSKTFVFNRWSQASYAVFNSLRIVVNIGRMRIDMLPAADLKSKYLVDVKTFITNLLTEPEEEDGDLTLTTELAILHLPTIDPFPQWGRLHKILLAFTHLFLKRSMGKVRSFDFKTLQHEANC